MPQKILGVVILAIFSAQDALPQVCGLSASKIGACNATPVPAHSLEFEPVFTSLWSNRLWDEHARNLPRFESPDSIEHITHLCFRASYGISKNLEAGLYMSSDLSGIGFAGKYRFLQQDQQEFALLLGYHHKGQGTGDEDTGLLHELESSLAMGLAWTRRLRRTAKVRRVLRLHSRELSPSSF